MLLFHAGDMGVLVMSSVVAAWIMRLAHEQFPSGAMASLLGMVAAMAALMLLAAAAGTVLGSIETKVPAMLAGMIAPMTICALYLARPRMTSLPLALTSGALTGLVIAVGLIAYGRRCRRAFTEGQWRA